MARRRLILLRHGDAELPEGAVDHDRLLTARGEAQAANMGARLVEVGWLPDAVMTSSAKRAEQSAALVLVELGSELGPTVLSSLYEGGMSDVQRALASLPDAVLTALLVGHNPTLSGVASVLSGVRVSLSTGNAALLELDAPSWGDAARTVDGWSLVHHLTGE